MIISKLMYDFLKSYVKWIEEGAAEEAPYFRCGGLCGNLNQLDKDDSTLKDLYVELKTLFEAEDRNTRFPFGKENFIHRLQNETQHEDPLRLKWIKDHIEEYDKNETLKKEISLASKTDHLTIIKGYISKGDMIVQKLKELKGFQEHHSITMIDALEKELDTINAILVEVYERSLKNKSYHQFCRLFIPSESLQHSRDYENCCFVIEQIEAYFACLNKFTGLLKQCAIEHGKKSLKGDGCF